MLSCQGSGLGTVLWWPLELLNKSSFFWLALHLFGRTSKLPTPAFTYIITESL